MSINFKNDVSEETIALMKKALGEPLAHDRRTFLFNDRMDLVQSEMKKIANTAKQPVTAELNDVGDIKTLTDGTRYEVTPQGWRKLPK